MNTRTNTTTSAGAEATVRRHPVVHVWRHPIAVMAVVLLIATAGSSAIGMPLDDVTQIAIYTLYGAGTNFLIGYLGLVPFGASFFFGCSAYALAVVTSLAGGNEFSGVLIAGL
ncbi:MAG TPA: ABC transporter ATP-binding protein, partial [Paraburkholderia sp.]